MNSLTIKNRVGEFLKIFPTFLLIFFFSQVKASDSFKTPDFAFPQTVVQESDSLLQVSLAQGNGLMVLRSAMDLCVAKNLLSDSESVCYSKGLMNSIALKLTGNYQRLAYLLEATILKSEYSMNPGLYDSRKLPLDGEFPEDPLEWSGEMYKTSILNLIEKAIDGHDSQPEQTIKAISLLLSDWETADKIGLTVDGFIKLKSVDVLKSFAGNNDVTEIPFFPQEMAKTIEGRCRKEVKWILNNLIKDTSSNSILIGVAISEYSKLLSFEEREEYLKEGLSKLKGTEGEGVVLHSLCNEFDSEKRYYRDIETWLKEYPNGFYSGQLKYTLSLIAQERVEISLPKKVLTNERIQGYASITNASRIYLLLYSLEPGQFDQYDNLILKKFTGTSTPLQTIELIQEGEVPYTVKRDFELKGLTQGIYVIVPSLTPKLPKNFNKASSNSNYSTFRVSDIAIVTSNDGNKKESGRVYVVSGRDQQPVKGAVVKYFSGDFKKAKGSGVTGEDGSIGMPDGYYQIEASYGKNVAKSEFGFNYFPSRPVNSCHASILTDLSVYRPGDTIRYAVIGWQRDNRKNQILNSTRIDVSLRDVNYTVVGTDSLTLDNDGRSNGQIVIPKGRLLGRYTLTASFPDMTSNGEGSTSILVEDYKLPGFLVSLQQDKSKEDTLVFKGRALTYSGMPVTQGTVELNVGFSAWDWRGFGTNASYNTQTSTNEEGEFVVDLPTSGLKGTRYEKGRYSLTAEVTSESGETQKSAPLNFYLGDAFSIRPAVPDKIKIESDTVKLFIPVYDMAGLPVLCKMEYEIKNLNDTTNIQRGEFEGPNLYIPSNRLASGKYLISFNIGKENHSSVETVVWRATDKMTPYPTQLWVPEEQYVYKKTDTNIDVMIGGEKGEWILYMISDGEKEIKREWLLLKEEVSRLHVELPEGDPTLFINLSGMWNLEGANSMIKIQPECDLEKMEIATESFRDKLTAGDQEKWKFRFKIGDRIVPYVNVFAVMSDKALNAISDFKWNLGINSPVTNNKINLYTSVIGRCFTYKNFTNIGRYPGQVNLIPEWQTYNYPLVSWGGTRINGPIYLRSMKNAKMEYAVTDSLVMEEAEDEVAMEVPMASQAVARGVLEASSDNEKVELRPIEMPLAFFMPDLKANENGIIDISFSVPDFNTTWQLQVAGYDKDLHTACLVLDAVASKPLMIKTNLPQYLRTGDRGYISAVIFNNSEENLDIGGLMEIFNPFNGETLKVESFEGEEVLPSRNRVVTIGFEVPDNCTLVAVKAIGSARSHSDGEQGYFPILPSSTPVIEATTFYASGKKDRIEIKVPKIRKESNVTLKYCDNPLWEVLLSLTGANEEDSSSSLSIARWLYGTLISSDIIGNNIDIREGLKKILESQDSTLSESNLQKDQSLKLMSLEATPWVNNAKNETDRIRSLGRYLDQSTMESQIDLKIESLSKLQMNDGGWSWFEGMKSSPYITSEIIGILGYLNNQGLLNDELKEMARKSVKYYDNWLAETRKRDKNLSVVSTMNYLYSRSLLDLPLNKQMKGIEKECLDSIISQWRYWNLGNKAKGGLLLYKTGNNEEEVSDILESIKQFLGKKAPIQQEALILELFAETDADSEALDKVKENLFLQKETEECGKDVMTAGVIQALFQTAPKDALNRSMPIVFIGDEEIDLSETQSLSGNFTINLDASKVSGKKITIKRDGGLPAWGGVISQYIAPVKDVKSSKVENLAIEKNVYMEDAKGKVREVKEFREGDKITLVLNIDCRKEMDYVAIVDSRAACLQPDAKSSGMIWIDGVSAYQEIRKDRTSFFLEHLPAGKYVISYECHAERAGEYSLGIVSAQCLYSPSQTAHSSGKVIKVINIEK